MSSSDKNNTESPDIIEEIIPGKNNDYNDKSINQNNSNNQQSSIENYDEEESAQAVIEASEESIKTLERNTDKALNQIPRYSKAITNNQEQTTQATKVIAENYLEYQKQAFNSFQSVFMTYYENVRNQLWNNQEFFKRIPETYSRVVSMYTENAIIFNRILNDMIFSNMNYFINAINEAKEQSKHLTNIGKRNVSAYEGIREDNNTSFPYSSSSVNQNKMGKVEVDNGRNSDENSTNVKATFSCEKCGQIFDSRQDLKEHSSTTH